MSEYSLYISKQRRAVQRTR